FHFSERYNSKTFHVAELGAALITTPWASSSNLHLKSLNLIRILLTDVLWTIIPNKVTSYLQAQILGFFIDNVIGISKCVIGTHSVLKEFRIQLEQVRRKMEEDENGVLSGFLDYFPNSAYLTKNGK